MSVNSFLGSLVSVAFAVRFLGAMKLTVYHLWVCYRDILGYIGNMGRRI